MSRWDNITSAATEAATFVEDIAAQAVDFTTKKIDQGTKAVQSLVSGDFSEGSIVSTNVAAFVADQAITGAVKAGGSFLNNEFNNSTIGRAAKAADRVIGGNNLSNMFSNPLDRITPIANIKNTSDVIGAFGEGLGTAVAFVPDVVGKIASSGITVAPNLINTGISAVQGDREAASNYGKGLVSDAWDIASAIPAVRGVGMGAKALMAGGLLNAAKLPLAGFGQTVNKQMLPSFLNFVATDAYPALQKYIGGVAPGSYDQAAKEMAGEYGLPLDYSRELLTKAPGTFANVLDNEEDFQAFTSYLGSAGVQDLSPENVEKTYKAYYEARPSAVQKGLHALGEGLTMLSGYQAHQEGQGFRALQPRQLDPVSNAISYIAPNKTQPVAQEFQVNVYDIAKEELKGTTSLLGTNDTSKIAAGTAGKINEIQLQHNESNRALKIILEDGDEVQKSQAKALGAELVRSTETVARYSNIVETLVKQGLSNEEARKKAIQEITGTKDEQKAQKEFMNLVGYKDGLNVHQRINSVKNNAVDGVTGLVSDIVLGGRQATSQLQDKVMTGDPMLYAGYGGAVGTEGLSTTEILSRKAQQDAGDVAMYGASLFGTVVANRIFGAKNNAIAKARVNKINNDKSLTPGQKSLAIKKVQKDRNTAASVVDDTLDVVQDWGIGIVANLSNSTRYTLGDAVGDAIMELAPGKLAGMANRVNQIAINKAKEYATDFDPNYRIFKDMTQLNTLADEGVNMYVDNKIKQLQALPTRTPEQTKEMQDIIAIKDDQLAVNQTFAQQREAVKVQMVEAQQQIKPMNDIEYISNDVAINQLRYDNLKESLGDQHANTITALRFLNTSKKEAQKYSQGNGDRVAYTNALGKTYVRKKQKTTMLQNAIEGIDQKLQKKQARAYMQSQGTDVTDLADLLEANNQLPASGRLTIRAMGGKNNYRSFDFGQTQYSTSGVVTPTNIPGVSTILYDVKGGKGFKKSGVKGYLLDKHKDANTGEWSHVYIDFDTTISTAFKPAQNNFTASQAKQVGVTNNTPVSIPMIFELDDTEQLISNAEGGIDLESGVDLDIKADSTINIIDKDEIKIAQEIYAKLKPTIEYVDFDNGRQGQYLPDTNTIQISNGLSTLEKKLVVIHELMHAATYNIIQDGRRGRLEGEALVYYEKLVALYTKAKNQYDKNPNERAAHSMNSIEEFAVSWTNPDALSFLDSPTIFFRRFLDAVIGALKFVGIELTTYRMALRKLNKGFFATDPKLGKIKVKREDPEMQTLERHVDALADPIFDVDPDNTIQSSYIKDTIKNAVRRYLVKNNALLGQEEELQSFIRSIVGTVSVMMKAENGYVGRRSIDINLQSQQFSPLDKAAYLLAHTWMYAETLPLLGRSPIIDKKIQASWVSNTLDLIESPIIKRDFLASELNNIEMNYHLYEFFQSISKDLKTEQYSPNTIIYKFKESGNDMGVIIEMLGEKGPYLESIVSFIKRAYGEEVYNANIGSVINKKFVKAILDVNNRNLEDMKNAGAAILDVFDKFEVIDGSRLTPSSSNTYARIVENEGIDILTSAGLLVDPNKTLFLINKSLKDAKDPALRVEQWKKDLVRDYILSKPYNRSFDLAYNLKYILDNVEDAIALNKLGNDRITNVMVKALYEQNRELDNRTQLLKEKYTNSDINVIFTVGPESKAKIDWVNKQKKNHTILSWHDEIVAYLKEEGTDEQVASYKKTGKIKLPEIQVQKIVAKFKEVIKNNPNGKFILHANNKNADTRLLGKDLFPNESSIGFVDFSEGAEGYTLPKYGENMIQVDKGTLLADRSFYDDLIVGFFDALSQTSRSVDYILGDAWGVSTKGVQNPVIRYNPNQTELKENDKLKSPYKITKTDEAGNPLEIVTIEYNPNTYNKGDLVEDTSNNIFKVSVETDIRPEVTTITYSTDLSLDDHIKNYPEFMYALVVQYGKGDLFHDMIDASKHAHISDAFKGSNRQATANDLWNILKENTFPFVINGEDTSVGSIINYTNIRYTHSRIQNQPGLSTYSQLQVKIQALANMGIVSLQPSTLVKDLTVAVNEYIETGIVKDIFDGGMFERTKETPLFGERFWTESSLNDNGIIAIANLLDIDILSDVDINVTGKDDIKISQATARKQAKTDYIISTLATLGQDIDIQRNTERSPNKIILPKNTFNNKARALIDVGLSYNDADTTYEYKEVDGKGSITLSDRTKISPTDVVLIITNTHKDYLSVSKRTENNPNYIIVGPSGTNRLQFVEESGKLMIYANISDSMARYQQVLGGSAKLDTLFVENFRNIGKRTYNASAEMLRVGLNDTELYKFGFFNDTSYIDNEISKIQGTPQENNFREDTTLAFREYFRTITGKRLGKDFGTLTLDEIRQVMVAKDPGTIIDNTYNIIADRTGQELFRPRQLSKFDYQSNLIVDLISKGVDILNSSMNKAINDLASAVLLQTGKEYALDRDIDAKDGNTFNDQIPLELKNALQTILNNSPDGINTFKVFDFNDEVTLEDSAIENDLQEAEGDTQESRVDQLLTDIETIQDGEDGFDATILNEDQRDTIKLLQYFYEVADMTSVPKTMAQYRKGYKFNNGIMLAAFKDRFKRLANNKGFIDNKLGDQYVDIIKDRYLAGDVRAVNTIQRIIINMMHEAGFKNYKLETPVSYSIEYHRDTLKMFESQKGLINKNMNTIKERMFLDKENPVYEYSDTAEKLLRPSVDLKFEMEGTLLPLVERANGDKAVFKNEVIKYFSDNLPVFNGLKNTLGKKIIVSTEQLTNTYSIPQVVAEILNEYEVMDYQTEQQSGDSVSQLDESYKLTTHEAIQQGYRTSTTRPFASWMKPGNIVQFEGKGKLYEVVSVQDAKDIPMEEWIRTEHVWNEEGYKKRVTGNNKYVVYKETSETATPTGGKVLSVPMNYNPNSPQFQKYQRDQIVGPGAINQLNSNLSPITDRVQGVIDGGQLVNTLRYGARLYQFGDKYLYRPEYARVIEYTQKRADTLAKIGLSEEATSLISISGVDTIEEFETSEEYDLARLSVYTNIAKSLGKIMTDFLMTDDIRAEQLGVYVDINNVRDRIAAHYGQENVAAIEDLIIDTYTKIKGLQKNLSLRKDMRRSLVEINSLKDHNDVANLFDINNDKISKYLYGVTSEGNISFNMRERVQKMLVEKFTDYFTTEISSNSIILGRTNVARQDVSFLKTLVQNNFMGNGFNLEGIKKDIDAQVQITEATRLLNLQNKNLLAKYEDARDKISKLSQKISEIENSNEYKDVVAAQYSKDDISYTEIIEKISEIDSQIRLSKDALSVLGGSDIELVTDTKELLKLKKEYFSSSLELVKNNPLWQDYYSSYSLLEKGKLTRMRKQGNDIQKLEYEKKQLLGKLAKIGVDRKLASSSDILERHKLAVSEMYRLKSLDPERQISILNTIINKAEEQIANLKKSNGKYIMYGVDINTLLNNSLDSFKDKTLKEIKESPYYSMIIERLGNQQGELLDLILDKANKGKLWFTDLDKIDNDQLYIKDTNTIEFQNFEKLWSDLSPFMAGKGYDWIGEAHSVWTSLSQNEREAFGSFTYEDNGSLIRQYGLSPLEGSKYIDKNKKFETFYENDRRWFETIQNERDRKVLGDDDVNTSTQFADTIDLAGTDFFLPDPQLAKIARIVGDKGNGTFINNIIRKAIGNLAVRQNLDTINDTLDSC